MKLSTRTRYGMRAVVELAQNTSGKPMQLKNIAKHQEISLKYLEQLIAMLKTAGFVSSVRGSKGGYILARPADQIKLSEVFSCLEGQVNTVDCVKNNDICNRASDCVVRQVWVEVQDAIYGVLEALTLQDMADRAREVGNSDYQI